MKKQIVVIGLGRFGMSVASTLQNLGHDVSAVDKDETKVASIAALQVKAIQADAINETVLKDLGVGDVDVAIIAIGENIESSVLCTIMVKNLGVPYIIARANDPLHGSILEKIGANVVVYPELETGVKTAHSVSLRDVSDYMPISRGYGVSRISATPYIIGQRLYELGLGQRGKWEVALLFIQRKDEIIISPEPGEQIKKDDILVIVGHDDKVERFLTEAKNSNAKG